MQATRRSARFGRSVGTLSEQHASKKNMAEEARLRNALMSINRGYFVNVDIINNRIRETRTDLRNVRMSTGHSIEALRPAAVPRSSTRLLEQRARLRSAAGSDVILKAEPSTGANKEAGGVLIQRAHTWTSDKATEFPHVGKGVPVNARETPRVNETATLPEAKIVEMTPPTSVTNSSEVTIVKALTDKQQSGEVGDSRLGMLSTMSLPLAIGDQTIADLTRTSNSEGHQGSHHDVVRTRCRTCLRRFRYTEHRENRALHAAETAINARMRSRATENLDQPSENTTASSQADPSAPGKKEKEEKASTDGKKEDKKVDGRVEEVQRSRGGETGACRDRRGYSRRRMEELASPRTRPHTRMLFAKGHIKGEVAAMTQDHVTSRMTSHERDRLRRLESKVRMFLTLLRCGDHASHVVHIPQRDDVMKVDISHVG